MATYDRIQQEQEIFKNSKSKRKISAAKKQAQLADISNTGKGTINIKGDKKRIEVLDKQIISTGNILDSWDDDEDLEAF
ncbi:hypothetical protein [Psychromonas sp. GE-S-Ul-11]